MLLKLPSLLSLMSFLYRHKQRNRRTEPELKPEQEQGQIEDLDDPTAELISSGIRTGTNGYGAIAIWIQQPRQCIGSQQLHSI